MTTTTTEYARFVRRLNDALESANHAVEKWGQKFAENPGYALSWGADVFAAAAQKDVVSTVLAWVGNLDEKCADLDDATKFERLMAAISKEALGRATRVEQSTSPTSNLYADQVRAFWATIARNDYLGW